MRICGVDLVGNEAVICLLELKGQQFILPECRVRKLALPKEHSREDLQQFQFAFAKLMTDYKVSTVAIRERQTKGKFAGGAVSFKMEAAIQLISALDVLVLSAVTSKAILKENRLPLLFSETGLKGFQEAAFTVSYVAHRLGNSNLGE